MSEAPTPATQRGLVLRPGVLTFIVGLLVLCVAGLVYQQSLVAAGKVGSAALIATSSGSEDGTNVKYVCPMRCVELDEPGDCPVCGMETTAVTVGEPLMAPTAGGINAAPTYVCPMHPQIVQDRPGTCPICAMELVPQRAQADEMDPLLADAVESVRLSPSQAVLANVSTVHPDIETMALTVPAIGEVAVPQDQTGEVVAWQDGRVDNLLLAETGGFVREGEHILDLYSEELVQAQEEYLLALKAEQQLGDSRYETISASTRSLLDASRQRLLREGMTAEQIANLEQSGKVTERIPIYAKEGGVVLEKMITEGDYVMQGERMFSVADLDPIWVQVEVFEKDAPEVKVGDRIKLTSPAHPGQTFSGRVQLIEPVLDEDTRTYQLRVEVANPGMKLRPGMFLDAELAFDYGDLLLLPRNAVLHTGDADVVYVQTGENAWAPREVELGRDFGDRVEVVSGLKRNEAVAASAVFLLDSEAQLKGIPRPGE